MKRRFTKMQGCGNDYIYFDCVRDGPLADPAAVSRRLSRRRFSVGGDGIILIEPSEAADCRMRIFNRDGSEGRMCGNGIRCVGRYVYERGIAHKNPLTVETKAGVKTLFLRLEGERVTAVQVDMGPAVFAPAAIPARFAGDRVIDRPFTAAGRVWRITCLSMGNPHCVVFADDPDALPLDRIGPAFTQHPLFPEQVNIEFVRVMGPNELAMRVWERGSGETFACGTGACAAAVAAVRCGHCRQGEEILVHLRGGDLRICETDGRVLMTGPAEIAYEGEVEIE